MPGTRLISEPSIDQSLHNAIKRGDFIDASNLVESGVDPDGEDPNGDAPLHLLLKNEAKVDERDELHGATAPHLAAHDKRNQVIKLLLEHGADVNKENRYGNTALHFAARGGHTEIVGLLLKHGADVRKKNGHGDTALHCAADNGHTETARLLLKHRADVRKKNERGDTALHCAASNGHTEAIELLLNCGAEINHQNVRCHTALHEAVISHKISVVQLLLERKADINRQGDFGSTALHFAASRGYVEIVTCLLKYGAKLDILDKHRRTVLQTAVFKSQFAVVKLLVHEHFSRSTDIEKIIEKIEEEIATADVLVELREDDAVKTKSVRDLCKSAVPEHQAVSSKTILDLDGDAIDVPNLTVGKLLDRSRRDRFMKNREIPKTVYLGLWRSIKNVDSQLTRRDSCCLYCLAMLKELKELLETLKERKCATDAAVITLWKYQDQRAQMASPNGIVEVHQPPKDEGGGMDRFFTMEKKGLQEVLGAALSHLSTKQIRFFGDSLSLSNDTHVDDSTELRGEGSTPDAGIHSLKL